MMDVARVPVLPAGVGSRAEEDQALGAVSDGGQPPVPALQPSVHSLVFLLSPFSRGGTEAPDAQLGFAAWPAQAAGPASSFECHEHPAQSLHSALTPPQQELPTLPVPHPSDVG